MAWRPMLVHGAPRLFIVPEDNYSLQVTQALLEAMF